MRGAKPMLENRSSNSGWIPQRPGAGHRSHPQISLRPSRLPHSGHLPPPSESRKIQRQRGGSDPPAQLPRWNRGRLRGGLEIESAENAVGRAWTRLRGQGELILSYHNYDGTPSPEAVLRRMLRIPADGYKIVTTARKPSDNYRVLALTKSHPRTPLIVLAMGETGFPTRVLSTAWGGLFTYAAPNASEGTACGQVSARLLRALYRAEKFSHAAKIYGVIADPVRHSISPAVHNRAFQAHRLDAVYLPFLVQPDAVEGFLPAGRKTAGGRLQRHHPTQAKNIALSGRSGSPGAPDRRGQYRLAESRTNGAARTRTPPPSPSHSPASCGFRNRPFLWWATEARRAARPMRWWSSGANVSIVGRNPDRVRALAQACGAEPLLREQSPVAQVRRAGARHAAGHVSASWTAASSRTAIPAELVFDMVYNPLETALLKRAKAQGLTVITGLQMFLEQAARQYEIWTGASAPRTVMEKAAMEALASGF